MSGAPLIDMSDIADQVCGQSWVLASIIAGSSRPAAIQQSVNCEINQNRQNSFAFRSEKCHFIENCLNQIYCVVLVFITLTDGRIFWLIINSQCIQLPRQLIQSAIERFFMPRLHIQTRQISGFLYSKRPWQSFVVLIVFWMMVGPLQMDFIIWLVAQQWKLAFLIRYGAGQSKWIGGPPIFRF